jgi:O-antigen/teichoic acid export membrane protein
VKKLQALLANDFVRHNLVFLVGSVLVGVGNYLFYPALARTLSPEPFGEVQALAALFLQLVILLSVMGQVTVNVIANYTDEQKKREVLFELEKLAFLVIVGVSLVLAVLSPHLKAALQFESVVPFLVLLAALVVTVPGSFRNAFLRAHKKFGATSVAMLVGAYGKVVLGVLFTYLGYKVGGAMWAIFIAQLLTLWYATHAAKKAGYRRPNARLFSKPKISLVLPELKYALLVLVGFGTVTLLASLDVFVVRYYFDPQTAGEYAGVSTVAKIIFFFTASVAQVMFASLKMRDTSGANQKLFARSFGLVAGMGGVALVVFALAPETIVTLLMGSSYGGYSNLLPMLGLAMLLVSLLNVSITYYIALRAYLVGVIVLAGMLLVAVLMVVNHDTLSAVIANLLFGTTATLGLFVCWRVVHKLRKVGTDAAVT